MVGNTFFNSIIGCDSSLDPEVFWYFACGSKGCCWKCGQFPVKQTLTWRLACRIVTKEGFWIDTCEREETEAGLDGEISHFVIQFQ